MAGRLDVHYMTVYKYVRTGRLPARKVSCAWQVSPDDVAAFAAHPRAVATGAGSGRDRYAELLENRLQRGDEAGAWRIIDDASAGGMGPADVLLDLVVPAMASIGDQWERGRVDVADEHRATATASRLVARLGPRFAVRGRPRGHVLLGAAPGDHHGLPTAILRDLLRGRNLEVTDLGADVPVDSWSIAAASAEIGSPRLVAVGIGATTPDETLHAALLVIRAATEAPIVLGGRVSNTAVPPDPVPTLHRSTSLRQAVELFDELATTAPTARRP